MIFHNYKYCFLPFQFPKPSPPISSQLTNPPSSKWPPSRLPELLAAAKMQKRDLDILLLAAFTVYFSLQVSPPPPPPPLSRASGAAGPVPAFEPMAGWPAELYSGRARDPGASRF